MGKNWWRARETPHLTCFTSSTQVALVVKEHVIHLQKHFRLALLCHGCPFLSSLFFFFWLSNPFTPGSLDFFKVRPPAKLPDGFCLVWRGDICLLSVPGHSEGAGHSALRTLVLLGLHSESLGQEGQQRPVQLPPVSAGVQASALAGQKHRVGGGYGETEG